MPVSTSTVQTSKAYLEILLEMNYKQQDRQRILSYLDLHPRSTVKSIYEESGAERLRIYPILFELIQKQKIRILEESEWGAPLRVEKIKNEFFSKNT